MGTLVEQYAAFAIDLDGVIWRGGSLIDGAASGIAAIREAGKPLLVLTNNGAYVPSSVVARLRSAGIELEEREILTSLTVAREWVRRRELTGAPAFVLASPEVVGQVADMVSVVPVARGVLPALVLVGRDTEISFGRLAAAADAVRAGAAFVSLNRDATLPLEGGYLDPGTGAILAALEVASGRRAVVVGKPEAPMMEAAAARLGPGPILMVGDRLESDIAGALRMGWGAALVLTGVTAASDRLDPAPDYVLDSVAGIAGEAEPYRH
ncbi:MAG: HAD-IIA family hydrolase [Actinomycetota bacterium]